MPQAIDFSSIPDKEREAFYGLLFAIAAADGSFDGEEMSLIHSMLDITGLSQESRDKIRTFRVNPPDSSACLATLSNCQDELRHGTMMSLVDIALADGILTESEERALDEAATALGIRPDQLQAMLELVDEASDILNRGKTTELDNSKLRQKARDLSESGITHSAAFFSGTIIRLISAAREAVGNALNIGLGQIPGAPISVIVGYTVTISVSELLSNGEAVRPDTAKIRIRQERAHEAIEHLQASVDELIARIDDKKNGRSPDCQEDLETLESLCDGLKQLARTRRSALEEG